MDESLIGAVDCDNDVLHSSFAKFDRDCEVIFPASGRLLDSYVTQLGASDEILCEEATKSYLLFKDFNYEEEAYDSYNKYAFKHGFGIRIDKSKTRNDSSLKMKRFVCCNEGWKDDKAKNKRSYEKLEIRTGCLAFIQFKIDRSGLWTCFKHYMKHNHHMIPLEKRHLLRSQRSVFKENLQFMSTLRCSGVKVFAALRAMKQDVGGSPNLGFTGPDTYNALSAEKQYLLDCCDSHQLIKYFAKRQLDKLNFITILNKMRMCV